MSQFLTTHAAAANIENIIRNSKEKLFLVSPYLKLSRIFFDRLKDADERGVKIVIVYGKEALEAGEKTQLEKLKNLSLFFCENLHAKCYFNEENMVITSMNMYEFSEKNNREMGVLITIQDDAGVFKDAMREVQSIVRASVEGESESSQHHQQPAPESPRDKRTAPAPNAQKGSAGKVLLDTLRTILTGEKLDAYCIRCGDRLPFDPYHPLCDKCYYVWSDYGNPDSPERYCHSCGKETDTTKEKPLCHSCYTKSR